MFMQITGLCAFIPVFLALYPIAFYYIGAKLGQWIGFPGIAIFFLFIGIYSGIHQTYLLMRKVSKILE